MFEFSGRSLDLSRKNFLLVSTLALQAGAINIGGYLAAHRFVSHTTGFATLFGSDLASGRWVSGFGLLSVPLFFLLGSAFSALLVDIRLSQGLRPHYPLLFFLVSLMMYGVSLFGSFGFLGGFGSPANIYSDYALLASLCLSAGMQNAAITSASGSSVRTTHLTGATTDIGISLTRMFFGFGKSLEEKASLYFRLNVLFSFILGSAIFAFVFSKLEYWGFLGPGLISSLLAFYALRRP